MKTTIDSLEICQEESIQSIVIGKLVEKETSKKVIKESQVESVYISSDIENVNMHQYASVMHDLLKSNMHISNNSDVIKKEDITSLLMDTHTKVLRYRKITNNEYSQRCILQFIRSNKTNADNEINGYFINALLERLLKRIYYTERNKVYHSHYRNKERLYNKMLDCRIEKKEYSEYVYWNIDICIMDMEYRYNPYIKVRDIENQLNHQCRYSHNVIIEYNKNNIFDIVNIEQIDIVQYSNIDISSNSNNIVITI